MKAFALLFPGQGSQSSGMGKSLHDSFAIARQVFAEGSEALGIDLKKLCFEASEAELKLTENTQPAIVATSVAAFKIFKQELPELVPSFTAGHSVGEYSALVASGVLDFSTAIRAVRLRGKSMQEAVPQGLGGMVAGLGLDSRLAEIICTEANKAFGEDSLSAANFNAPGQIVLSGKLKVIDALSELTSQINWANFNLEAPKRLKWVKLEVSAPFHSPLMRPAEEKMREFFKNIEFKPALIPVVQNLTAQAHSEPAVLKENLIQQVSRPVRWEESVRFMAQQGCFRGVELGQGQVLKGLVKKILPDQFQVLNLGSAEDLKPMKGLLNESQN
jgi:[acyl-carrier-protein] S-malonyltransferase